MIKENPMPSMEQSIHTLNPTEPDLYAQQVNAQALEHLFHSLPRVAGTVLVPMS